MFKIDLHTHSEASPDGGIKAEGYQLILHNKQLDFIAVTDHNRIDFALHLHSVLGNKIIVGEEIMTREGEIIGLFLSKVVKPGLGAIEAAQAIKDQGGIVYIPHPFETVRKGLNKQSLDRIADLVDIVEVHNGRAVFQNKGPQATTWATLNRKAKASSSDAHGIRGLGHSFTEIEEEPTKNNLMNLLSSKAIFRVKRPPLKTLLYPKMHRLRKLIRK